MCPMDRSFNSGVWNRIEGTVRELNKLEDVNQVHAISGPIFNFCFVIKTITTSVFKSVLAERRSGSLHI